MERICAHDEESLNLDSQKTSSRRSRRGRAAILAVLCAWALAIASPAAADEYDATEAGHPLRIIAYIVHPIGVAFDYLLMRPAHWLVSHEPFKTAFGHED